MADLIAYTDLQSYLGVTFNLSERVTAELACSAASDGIKNATGRTFERQGNAAARYFTYTPAADSASYGSWYYYPWPAVFPFTAMNMTLPVPVLDVDDYFLSGQTIGSITVTDYTTGTAYTPARGYPFNADSRSDPFTGLVFAAGTGLPSAEAQLVVTAKWGWTALPNTILNASLIQASRYFKRTVAPFGVAGIDQASGIVMRLKSELDPDVFQMVSSFRRWWVAA